MSESYPKLELHLRGVARLAALDGDLPSQLHGHGAHQDALAVRVGHRQLVVLTTVIIIMVKLGARP